MSGLSQRISILQGWLAESFVILASQSGGVMMVRCLCISFGATSPHRDALCWCQIGLGVWKARLRLQKDAKLRSFGRDNALLKVKAPQLTQWHILRKLPTLLRTIRHMTI